MPSSISNSELARPADSFQVLPGGKTRRSIWTIVVGLVLTALVAEGLTIVGVHRVSKVLRHTAQEYNDAEKLSPYSAGGKTTVLLLGNSLLLEAIDYPTLRRELSPEYEVHRLVFEQTEYLEQCYVLRALLGDGAGGTISCCVPPSITCWKATLGGEFMSRFMDAHDIASLGHRQDLDATTVSGGLIFAHWSEW